MAAILLVMTVSAAAGGSGFTLRSGILRRGYSTIIKLKNLDRVLFLQCHFPLPEVLSDN
jgi:hypothetical protein